MNLDTYTRIYMEQIIYIMSYFIMIITIIMIQHRNQKKASI